MPDAATPMDMTAPAACAGQSGPDCVLELPEVNDVSTLNLSLDGPITMVTSDSGVTVVQVPFRYDGVPWRGMTWTHRSVLYLPTTAPAGGFTGVGVYSEQMASGMDTPQQAVEQLAGIDPVAATSVPVAVLGSLPPVPATMPSTTPEAMAVLANHPELQSCFDTALAEADLQTCSDKLLTASQDVTWHLAAALARGYLRGLVALRNLGPLLAADSVGATLGKFQPTSFLTGGYSKRGMAQWFVAAADPSVKAIWVGAGELPDMKTYAMLKWSEWGDQTGLVPQPSFYDTPFGQESVAQLDPQSWATRYAQTKISAVRGSNDEIWPFGLLASYPSWMTGLQNVGIIGDAMHLYGGDSGYTIADTDLLASWRGALGQLAGKAAAPTITATFDVLANPIQVTATVSGAGPSAQVRVWWTSALHCSAPMPASYAIYNVWGKDDADMRDVAWMNKTLTGSNGSYTGTLPVGLSSLPLHGQLFVDVRETDRFASTIPMAVSGGTDVSCH